MSLDNVQNTGQKNISWESISKKLKANNADQKTIDKMKSVFQSFDRNFDNTLSQDEINNAFELLNALDKTKDGKLSNEELNASKYNNSFKQAGADVTNQFVGFLNNTENPYSEMVSDEGVGALETGTSNPTSQSSDLQSPGGEPQPITSPAQNSEASETTSDNTTKQDLSQYEHDSDGNVITYPKEGLTFKQQAKLLGFEPGTPEYEEFVKANPDAEKRNWFIVNEKIKIPESIQDKVKTEALLNSDDSKAEISKYNSRPEVQAANTKSENNTQKADGNYPKSVQDRIAQLKQSGDTYEVTGNAQDGFTIKVTGGKYMTKNNIGQIEMKYDSAGNLQTYTQKYNNGQVNETTYTGGKKTKIIAQAAPEKFQKIAANLQKESGGKARIEYNQETGNYEIVQTDINYKDVKEIRTVLSDKAWQEKMSSGEALQEGVKDAWDTFRLVDPNSYMKAIKAGLRNREDQIADSDYFLSQTTVYNDGRITEGTYVDGKLKTNKVIQEAKTEKPQEVEPKEKINTAADITFNMPADAPENAVTFANSLINNKAELMQELGIDNDTYNILAQTAIGIAGKETNFGEKTVRQKAKDALRNIDVVSTRDWSYGMTQLKYTLHTQDPTIKKHMEALGITDEKQLLDPEVSAKATIVVLASLNKRLNTEKYQNGIEAAQDTIVQYKGWEINEQGTAEKTGNTQAWANNITRQDALCALWNGGEARSLLNGTFKPQGWEYTRVVNEYTQKYKLVETDEARAEAKEQHDATRAFDNMQNNGEMGSVVFLPAMYTDKARHLNTAAEIRELNQSLKEKGVDGNLRNQLVSALQNGELSFDFGLSKEEINSLTNADIKLLLTHLKELKTQVSSDGKINTSDGISSQEASILRNQYSETVGRAEDKFRQEYLNNHSAVYNASDTNPKVLREMSTTRGSTDFINSSGVRKGFRHETPLAVNENTTAGKISQQASILANAGYDVAMENADNAKSGLCLTGVKKAMSEAGIDVSQMIDYGSQPKYVKNWFEAHPEMFTPIEYVSNGDGTAREINAADLKNLPAGCIVIWVPGEDAAFEDQPGHIAITNGNGQGYADATDNLEWGSYNNAKAGDSGKGEHGTFVVYKLSDNWTVDPSTGKLVLNS